MIFYPASLQLGIYTKELEVGTQTVFVHQCSCPYYSQQLKGWNNQDPHQLMKDYTKCGVSI